MSNLNDNVINDLIFASNQIIYDSRYQYDLLQYKHIDEVVAIFTQSFCNSEPMTQYVAMEYEKFIPFARKVVEKAAKDGLSVVALDNGKVVAFAIAEDLCDPLIFDIDLDPRFQYIFSLLESLGEPFFKTRQFNTHQIAHLFITAVDEHYRGHKLSTYVNFKCMELAKRRNYSHMYCEFTNSLNEKGTLKYIPLKKLMIASIHYKQFLFGNILPFKYLSDSATSVLWELGANLPLTYFSNGQWYTKTINDLSKEYKVIPFLYKPA